MAMDEVPTYPHTPLAFPASTYDLRYGLGLQRVDPQLDASYRPFADSHERKPYLYDLQDTLVHYNIGTPIDLLSQPRPIYFTDSVQQKMNLQEHFLMILIAGCIVASSFAYFFLERILRRAGVYPSMPVFSKQELVANYDATLSSYSAAQAHWQSAWDTHLGPRWRSLWQWCSQHLAYAASKLSPSLQSGALRPFSHA